MLEISPSPFLRANKRHATLRLANLKQASTAAVIFRDGIIDDMLFDLACAGILTDNLVLGSFFGSCCCCLPFSCNVVSSIFAGFINISQEKNAMWHEASQTKRLFFGISERLTWRSSAISWRRRTRKSSRLSWRSWSTGPLSLWRSGRRRRPSGATIPSTVSSTESDLWRRETHTCSAWTDDGKRPILRLHA